MGICTYQNASTYLGIVYFVFEIANFNIPTHEPFSRTSFHAYFTIRTYGVYNLSNPYFLYVSRRHIYFPFKRYTYIYTSNPQNPSIPFPSPPQLNYPTPHRLDALPFSTPNARLTTATHTHTPKDMLGRGVRTDGRTPRCAAGGMWRPKRAEARLRDGAGLGDWYVGYVGYWKEGTRVWMERRELGGMERGDGRFVGRN